MIIALSVTVIEPLASFHDRAKALFPNVPGSPGLILPDAWEAGRGAINERGIAIGPEVEATLKAWGARLQVSWPTPLGPT